MAAIKKRILDSDEVEEELKSVGYDASAGLAFGTGSSPTLIFCPSQGSDITNRIGRETVLKSIYIRGDIQGLGRDGGFPDAAYTPQLLRMIFFVDWQVNGSAPAATDLLANTKTSPTLTSRSHLNLNYRDRFRILKDLTWLIGGYYKDSTNGIAWMEGNQSYSVKEFIDLSRLTKENGIKTTYKVSPGTGVVGDIATGAVFVLCLSQQATSPHFYGFIRSRFTG